jgi:2,3-dihydroxybiphenyl 1,2-dioxygenase
MRGVERLGYLGFEVSNVDAWHHFAEAILGLGVCRTGNELALQVDEFRQRILIAPGPADDLFAVGWEVADEAALLELAGRLERAGIPVRAGSPQERQHRGVAGLVKLTDPAGVPLELFYGLAAAERPLVSRLVPHGFVTGEQGLGHLVVTANSQRESAQFYQQLLGFRLSDHIRCEYYGHRVDLAFYHTNLRHHSLAFGGPQNKRLHHFMLQVASIDDLGHCYDRVIKSPLALANTLGRHPNDRMLSFYAHTPSGFQFEYGWGARVIDDASWTPAEYDRISEWGHHPPQIFARRKP